MRATTVSPKILLAALLAEAPLLLAQDCGPLPPEDDPVLVGHPEVIAELEAEHGAAITLIRDYYDRSEEDISRFRIRDGSLAYAELDALRAAIPRLEGLVAVEYTHLSSPEDPWCGEGSEVTRYELDLVTKGLLGGSVPHVVVFELCRVHEEDPDRVRADTGALWVRDEAWVARVLRRAEAEVLRLVSAYVTDRELARDRIVGELLGCPAGTRYGHDGEAHFCASSGVKHGPYIKGELTETLVGPRLVEGWYKNGDMHGSWKQFDADGHLLSTTEWEYGQRVGWGGGF